MKPLTILFSTLILFSGSSFAYDINDLISDAKARYGQAYDEMTDMTIKQKATVSDEGDQATMSMTMYRKGDKWRNEAIIGSNDGGLEATTLFDGTDAWSMTMGMKTKLPQDETEMTGMAEAYWKDIPENAKMLGEENLNGRDCWIVEWNEDEESAPVKSWIDKDNFMHVQTVSNEEGKEMKIVNSDFRKVKGDFMIPYLTEVYSGGKQVMTSTIEEFTFNTGLSDDLFDPEKLGGAEMDMNNIDLEQLMKQAEEMKKKYGGGE